MTLSSTLYAMCLVDLGVGRGLESISVSFPRFLIITVRFLNLCTVVLFSFSGLISNLSARSIGFSGRPYKDISKLCRTRLGMRCALLAFFFLCMLDAISLGMRLSCGRCFPVYDLFL